MLTAQAVDKLRTELGLRKLGVAEYWNSLDELRNFRPDLWLPAVPTHGQNANLYDKEWLEILEEDRHALLR